MSVHDLARAASADLRSHTMPDVDAGLEALFVAHARRRRESRFAIALVAAAVVVTAWWGVAGLGDHRTGPEPAPSPSTGSPPLLVPQAKLCQLPRVTCLGHRTYRFSLTSPVTWRVPRGYGVDSGGGASSSMVESYAESGDSTSGVTVMEGVRAVSPLSQPDTRVPATAGAFVHWVSLRPFLYASAVHRITFDGRVAWQVRVRVKPHTRPRPGRCSPTPPGVQCHPVTYQHGAVTGLWPHMSADYTAVDLPGVGTVVVWSWTFGHDPAAALARNRRAVNAISLTR